MELKFEPEAIRALKIMEQTFKSVFITWKAWSWKSTLLWYWKENTKKKYIFLWTTWVSAEMIWWMTIHRFFNLKPWKNWSWFCAMTNDLRDFIKGLDSFIIDESSMERADLFDMIDKVMRQATWKDEFFWWKQLILVWDLYQLPPVPEKMFLDREKTKENPAYDKYNDKYNGKLFFFHWKSFDIKNFEIVQLKKVYRQEDQEFVNMLNLVRDWYSTPDIIKYFNSKLIKKEEIHPKAILLASINDIAYKYNREKLEELPWKTINSKAFISWDYPVEMYPNDLWINYKEWARVMFTVNHKEWYYVNWTLWTVIEVYQNSVSIRKDNWESVEVWRNQWLNTDWVDWLWNPIILWTFTQYPFKTAFAITIHKCQWKSFDHVAVSLGRGAFTAGQVYVAFSRARSFEWLQLLTKLKSKDIFADQDVINFLK